MSLPIKLERDGYQVRIKEQPEFGVTGVYVSIPKNHVLVDVDVESASNLLRLKLDSCFDSEFGWICKLSCLVNEATPEHLNTIIDKFIEKSSKEKILKERLNTMKQLIDSLDFSKSDFDSRGDQIDSLDLLISEARICRQVIPHPLSQTIIRK